LGAVKGGFFLRKKPLECVLPVYTNSENAITRAPGSYGIVDSGLYRNREVKWLFSQEKAPLAQSSNVNI
jgi:hypothetical protein